MDRTVRFQVYSSLKGSGTLNDLSFVFFLTYCVHSLYIHISMHIPGLDVLVLFAYLRIPKVIPRLILMRQIEPERDA